MRGRVQGECERLGVRIGEQVRVHTQRCTAGGVRERERGECKWEWGLRAECEDECECKWSGEGARTCKWKASVTCKNMSVSEEVSVQVLAGVCKGLRMGG